MMDDRSRRISRGSDLPMRFLRTDSSWYEDYWLSEPRRTDAIARSPSAILARFAFDRTASILRAVLLVVLGPTGSADRRNDVMRVVLLLGAMFLFESADHANAQCAARDALQRQLTVGTAAVSRIPQNSVTSASDVAVWKTIEIGTFSDSSTLLDAMKAKGCGVGDAAASALARPAFPISATKAAVELVTLSAVELGFRGETASLRQIYAAAQRLGFGLAPAEIALQLRLQYLDQPIGEFLAMGMVPIHTPTGEPVILTVANGGAGLILIGQDGRADVEIPVSSRFVFVRSGDATPAKAVRNAGGARPMQSPSEQFPGPWLEVTQEVRDILVLKKVSACGQAAGRRSSRNPDEYLLYCTSDEKLWTSWRVNPAAGTVRGPAKLFQDIALPGGY